MDAGTPLNLPGKEKTHKYKQICGIVPGLGGCQKFVYVFFWPFLMGEKKTHKQNSSQNPGTIPGKLCLRVLFFTLTTHTPLIKGVWPYGFTPLIKEVGVQKAL